MSAGVFRPRNIVVGTVALYFIACVVQFVEHPDAAERDAYLNACPAGEEAIRRRLMTPSAARFSDCVYRVAGPDSALVAGTVDSQNAFGAMLRTTWSAIVRRRAAGQWEAVYVHID